ncbi:DUF2975 domain-containing protein [Allonocardiopsis opalescens]|uniref:DUF2975 family protein n=1 Tax=Allonocardiopsis opalescens TaxID=1144618 RepID=A0A2T0QC01_9ACTN|nr:DUF2975 domain-containing protein [Allonocardiopsis opalescens]PRY01447.1 Protein of unknown function (DUF2975) [Allonocardiopsis opalescens]
MVDDEPEPGPVPAKWLGLFQVVVVLGLIAAVPLTALAAVQAIAVAANAGPPVIEMPVPVAAEAAARAVPDGYAQAAVSAADGPTGVTGGSVAVRPESSAQPGLAAVTALVTLPGLAVALVVLVLLYRLVNRVGSDRDLFSAATVHGLRRCGGLALGGAIGQLALTLVCYTALWPLVAPAGSHPGGTLPDATGAAAALVVGFALLAVAEVVRRGARMRAELEGIV